MKKGYESPIIYVERFEPNEYCSACDTVDVVMQLDCFGGKTLRVNDMFLTSGTGDLSGYDGQVVKDGVIVHSEAGALFRSEYDLDGDGKPDLLYHGNVAECTDVLNNGHTGCHQRASAAQSWWPDDAACGHEDVTHAHHHVKSYEIVYNHS